MLASHRPIARMKPSGKKKPPTPPTDVLDNILGLIGDDAPPKKAKVDTPQPSGSMSSFRIPKKSSAGPSHASEDKKPSIDPRLDPRDPKYDPKYAASVRQSQPDVKPSYADSMKRHSDGRVVSKGQSSSNDEFRQLEDINLKMNALRLDNNAPLDYVLKYHVDITKVFMKKGELVEKDACRGIRSDVARNLREQALYTLMYRIIQSDCKTFGVDRFQHVYDGGYSLYSNTLQLHEDAIFEKKFTAEEISQWDQIAQEVFRNCDVVVKMKLVQKVYIRGPLFQEDMGTGDREAMKFYEVLCSQAMLDGTYLNFLSKSFKKSNNDCKSFLGFVAKAGIEKSCKLVGSGPGFTKLIIQASFKISPFYDSLSLMDFIGRNMGIGGDQYNVARFLEKADKRTIEKLNSVLKGVAVQSPVPKPNGRTLYVKIDPSKIASRCKFADKDGRTTDVQEYFLTKHSLPLKYPNIPLAKEDARRESYYPIEVLTILPGQRVPSQVQSDSKIAAEMIDASRMNPAKALEGLKQELEKAMLRLNCENKFLKAFNVTVANDLEDAKARVIPPACIVAKDRTFEPRADRLGQFPLQNRYTFVIPAQIRGPFHIVCLDSCFDERRAREFAEGLAKGLREKGVNLDMKNVVISSMLSEDIDKMERFMNKCKENKAAIAIFLIKGKNEDCHFAMKYFERNTVVTQNLTTRVAEQVSKGQAATLSNVVAKLNCKLGGLNFDVKAPVMALKSSQCQAASYLKDRMFVGFELSHAAAQSFVDRELNVEVGEPSVVGMVYSTTHAAALQGSYSFQKPRSYDIMNADKLMESALLSYHEACKKLPKEVYVYRSGRSEGEVVDSAKEIVEMKRGIREAVRRTNSSHTPSITVLLATHSSVILFPENICRKDNNQQRMRDSEANIPAGTVVDKQIVSPIYQEFLLKSQSSLIGTSKPLCYRVLSNEDKHQLNLLENVTMWLCSGHQVCQKTVHKPNVLYAADLLAERGRNMWNFKKREIDRQRVPTAMYDIRDNEEPDDYFRRKTLELQSERRGHFWA